MTTTSFQTIYSKAIDACLNNAAVLGICFMPKQARICRGHMHAFFFFFDRVHVCLELGRALYLARRSDAYEVRNVHPSVFLTCTSHSLYFWYGYM